MKIITFLSGKQNWTHGPLTPLLTPSLRNTPPYLLYLHLPATLMPGAMTNS
jgi:hypothetical protein